MADEVSVVVCASVLSWLINGMSATQYIRMNANTAIGRPMHCNSLSTLDFCIFGSFSIR